MVPRVPEVACRSADAVGEPSVPSRYAAKEAMDWDKIQHRWDEYKHAAKRRWDKLSEQQLHGTRGSRQYLSRRVQEAYSLTLEEAERQVSAWQAQIP
jgi:uncharacterized protein YjbJ (UPF0337 family)